MKTKRLIQRITSLLLITILMVIGISGCNKDEKDVNENSPTLAITNITAWSFYNSIIIENTYLNRKETVTSIVVSGDMTSTIPMSLLYGNYVYKDDKKGCVIDENTAYSLFGTEDAVENMITYNEKLYCVRGVVNSSIPVFLYQGMDKGEEYTNLELYFSQMGNGEELATQFIKIYQLSHDYVIIDGYFLGKFIYTIMILPLWLLLIGFIIYAVIILAKKRNICAGVIILFIAICCCLFCYRVLGNPFHLPERLIPTMWSDFSFWTKQCNELKNQIFQIKYLYPNSKDVLLLNMIFGLPYYFICTIISYALTIMSNLVTMNSNEVVLNK